MWSILLVVVRWSKDNMEVIGELKHYAELLKVGSVEAYVWSDTSH